MSDRAVVLKRILGCMYPFLALEKGTRKIILIYHSIDGGPVSTRFENFRAQMAWLAEHADVVSLDRLLDDTKLGKEDGRVRVVLTFDDGYRTLFDTVAPILEEYAFPATVYLNTAEIGEEIHVHSSKEQGHYPGEEFMLWREVALLHQMRWTIGSHGVQHVDLCLCDENEIKHLLIGSKKIIEDRLGVICEHFSYTWGRNNGVVRNAVKSVGYRSAVAGIHAPVVDTSDVFALPRLDVRNDYSLEDFVAVVTGRWDYLKFIQSFKNFFR